MGESALGAASTGADVVTTFGVVLKVRLRRVVLCIVGLMAVVLLVVALFAIVLRVWTSSGDRSPLAAQELARGLTYERLVWDEPRPVVVHVATIDLSTGGIELDLGHELVPAGTEPADSGNYQVSARKTSDYVETSGVMLAVNGSFFFPFEEYPPWSNYPDTGEVVSPLGVVVDDGQRFGTRWQGATFSVAADDQIMVGEVDERAEFAVSGRTILLVDGASPSPDQSGLANPADAYPRTVIAADAERGVVYFVVVDGKQPGYSEGLTVDELTRFLRDLGVTDAIELDGGGSATMVMAEPSGGSSILNRPINTRIPGRERVVANQVGVRVCPSACPP